MATTYEPIATATASGSQPTITFSSIASTYTDLIVVATAIRSSADANTNYRFNSDTATNYSYTTMYGNGTSAVSARDSNITSLPAGYTTTGQQTQIIQIMNYSNATTYKTTITRQSNAGTAAQTMAGLWRSTAAINRIDFILSDGGNFGSGSTFTLYGIKAA